MPLPRQLFSSGKLSLIARRVINFIPKFKDLGLPQSIEKLRNFPKAW